MSNPETDTGISVIPIESMAEALGAFNTEAYCATYLATPTEPRLIADIIENLSVMGAYDRVDKKRFNVHSILNEMSPRFVSVLRDPTVPAHIRSNWASAQEGTVGEFTRGLSGSLLDFSHTTGIPIRAMTGEKRGATETSLHSVEIRIGLLALMKSFDDAQEQFSIAGLAQEAERYGATPGNTRNHVLSMHRHGLLASTGEMRSKRFRFATNHEGHVSVSEAVDRFLKITAMFSIGSSDAIGRGLDSGARILSNPPLLANSSSVHSPQVRIQVRRAKLRALVVPVTDQKT